MPSERTVKSIRLQGLREQSVITRGVEFYSCGCDRFLADDGRDERWHLCQYHDGFDEAAEQADELQAKIDAWAAADAAADDWFASAATEGAYREALAALRSAATKEDDCGG